MAWEGLRLGDLQRFVAVHESGSFTAAATGLDETPKQLSRRIAVIEEAVGTRLFHRTTRSVRPTPEADAILEPIVEAIEALRRAATSLRQADTLSGRVRLQVPTLFLDGVQAWTAHQMVHNPELSFEVLVGDHADDLVKRGVDICLTGVAPTGATVRVRRVAMGSPPLAAHASYITRHGLPERPEDLAEHECLRFAGPQVQTRWALVHPQEGRVEVPVRGRFASNDSRALAMALESGMGIGPVNDLDRNDLVEVLPGWRFDPLPLYIALTPGRRRLARIRHTAEALETIARAGAWVR